MFPTVSQQYLLRFLLLVVFSGCSAPVLTSRVVLQEPAWFVRLDSFATEDRASARYDHPVSWKDEDLAAVMAGLFLEERGGLMDNAKPPQSLFSAEEINLLYPAIRQAFEKATRTEWIVFVLVQPHGVETGVTSGALFVESHRLHVVVANHRRVLAQHSGELADVRTNPLHSIKGSGGSLAFEPPRFGLGSKANWSGGHRASASELVLDHEAFLSYVRLSASTTAPLRATPASGQPLSTDLNASHGRATDPDRLDQSSLVNRLQAQIERMKQQLVEKDLEIERLKRESTPSVPRP